MWPLSQLTDAIATIGALFLAGVFALAAITKGRDRSAAQAALQAFGVPEQFVTAGYGVLLGGESIVVLALVIPGARLVGAWPAAGVRLFWNDQPGPGGLEKRGSQPGSGAAG
jgi:hypothetical protein